jgi:uncharacterized short protein YbdD (DUF466 family)
MAREEREEAAQLAGWRDYSQYLRFRREAEDDIPYGDYEYARELYDEKYGEYEQGSFANKRAETNYINWYNEWIQTATYEETESRMIENNPNYEDNPSLAYWQHSQVYSRAASKAGVADSLSDTLRLAWAKFWYVYILNEITEEEWETWY